MNMKIVADSHYGEVSFDIVSREFSPLLCEKRFGGGVNVFIIQCIYSYHYLHLDQFYFTNCVEESGRQDYV